MDGGKSAADVGRELVILLDTLRKGIQAGHLHLPGKQRLCTEDVRCSSKSERSQIDSQAEMGSGAKCTLQRVTSAGAIDAPGAVLGSAGYAAIIGKVHLTPVAVFAWGG